ncbi:MAG: mannose-6-phosphate isomerase, class I [Spirochaetes bacterium]|nr:mannose-6-phosphate isomerase, class I [Spirochaetota bacterium]MBU1080228.1 mannose-6-phosphate isomerase, class I [Spirochaetota bacterium]
MAIYSLKNVVQRYDWGSPTALPLILGKDNPSGEPWAELWMGAHPKAPSIAVDPSTGAEAPLDALISDAPAAALGEETAARFGGVLPFLLKILSAAKPLSIQAHPSKRKAEHGFAREEFMGIPLDAPERNYKDSNHKPETVVALTRFEGLCGFRALDDIIQNVKLLAPSDWERYAGRLARDPGRLELSVFFYTFISLADEEKKKHLNSARARSGRIVETEPAGSVTSKLFSRVLTLMEAYPDDIGALAPLILNLFELEPGQALNLAAGVPHAYLGGTAVEIMANSDNVLRGGLTHKHMDVPELVSALSFESASIEPLAPVAAPDGFSLYPCDIPDYSISKAVVDGLLRTSGRAAAPEIVLCVDGSLEISASSGASVPLPRGASVFVTADEAEYSISGGGTAFRASVPV